LSFDEFDITDLWKIYEKSIMIGKKYSTLESLQKAEDDLKLSSSLFFNLKIPMLILFVKLVDCQEIKSSIQNSKQISYQNIFDSLCEIIDEDSTNIVIDQTSSKNELHIKSFLKKVAEKILNNGLLVFFPSEKERKECFLYMVEKNTSALDAKGSTMNLENSYMTKSDMSLKRPSTKLLFEAFCNLFCSNKSNLIQHLNKSSKMFDDSNDCKKMINLIEQIMNLSFVLNENSSKEQLENTSDQQDNLISALNNLIISMQSFLFYTIKEQLSKLDKTNSKIEINIKNFVIEYTLLLMKKSTQILHKFSSTSSEAFDDKKFRKFYNLSMFYNFVLWLIEIFNKLDLVTCTNLVETLIDFYKEIEEIIQKAYKNDKHEETEKVLKTWTFNSKTKSSMSDVSIDYNYPLANRFIIEFDSSSNLLNSDPVSE
jgi:hypothetical protein